MADQDWQEVKIKKRTPKPAGGQSRSPTNASVPGTYAQSQVNRPAGGVGGGGGPKVKQGAGNSQRSADYDKRAIDRDDGNYSGILNSCFPLTLPSSKSWNQMWTSNCSSPPG